MLRRSDRGRWVLFAQEHHAWLSGMFAAAWRGPDGAGLRPTLVLATALHDHPWAQVDSQLLLDRAHGRPHDFTDYPLAPKLVFYRTGLDRLETLSPYLAHLVSRHYTAFSGTVDVAGFQTAEAARRARLEPLLRGSDADCAVQTHDLRLLQWLDVLSLYVLLAPPDADAADRPSWLDPAAAAPRMLGHAMTLRWRDEATLSLHPFPLEATLAFTAVGRAIEQRHYTSDAELNAAWAGATPWTRSMRLVAWTGRTA